MEHNIRPHGIHVRAAARAAIVATTRLVGRAGRVLAAGRARHGPAPAAAGHAGAREPAVRDGAGAVVCESEHVAGVGGECL